MSATILSTILQKCAQEKKTVTYYHLLGEYNRNIDAHIEMPEMWGLLVEVGTNCFTKGEPPLNCLVVSGAKDKPAYPSAGFYSWLSGQFSYNLDIRDNDEAQKRIFEIFRDLCFQYWAIKPAKSGGQV